MNRFWPVRYALFVLLLFPTLTHAADTLPPDVEVAELKATLAEDPADIDAWIRLGDLQRFMGYRAEGRASLQAAAVLLKDLPEEERNTYAGSYYLARAWMEYDAGDWALSTDLAEMAVRFDPRSETWLIRALATAAANHPRGTYGKVSPPELKRAFKPLRSSFRQGPANGTRNIYWFGLVRMHHSRYLDKYTYERTIVGYRKPPYTWGEMECRRDWGAYFEDKDMWEQACQMYVWSAERSPISDGKWATKHERLSPWQTASDLPLPFWTNVDGGYVTGSPLAYSEFACDQLMVAQDDQEREKWANNLADGASRCMAVLTNDPLPWLWRGLADLIRGDPVHAAHDIAQAKAEFAALGIDNPLYAFAFGHEQVLKERFERALPWLQLAAEGLPQYAAIWSELGLAYARTNLPGEAMTAFTKALDIDPNLLSARYNRGLLLLRCGRTPEAKVDLEMAALMDPGNPQILTELQRAHWLERESSP